MSEDDFLQSLMKEGDGQLSIAQNRALDMVKKLNLPSRFTILADNPLEALSGTFSRAFEVNDLKQKDNICAKILPATIPIRFDVIQSLKSFHSNNFTNIIDSGLTDAGGGQFGSYAVVMEKPKGIKIAEYLKVLKAEQKAEAAHNQSKETRALIHEDFLAEEIIMPINEILRSFGENNISHGCINHETLYYNATGDYKFILTDPVSEPCGYSQPIQFEPIHRAYAMPLGKGAATVKDDYFALGVLVYYCVFGEIPAAGASQNDLIRSRVTKGTYNLYVGAVDLSTRLADILRGLLTDNQNERWGYDQVSQWIKGKRFNIIRPNVRKEAARNYDFAEALHPNKRSLAIGYHENWEEAAIDIRERKIVKWLELSAADKDTAGEVSSIIGATGGERTKSRQDNDELVAKTLMVLDNEAPIRFKSISVHIDGFGTVLANAWSGQNQTDLQYLLEIVRMNLLDFKALKEVEGSKIDRWTLQRQCNYIKFRTLGFGIERVLYDLNPTLPCQSPILAGQFIIDCSQLLYYLNDNAAKLAGNDPVDRHIAAFFAGKLELASEIKLKIMNRFRRNEAINTQLIKLALLAFAQKKTKVNKLNGLTMWVADKLKPIVNSIHSKDLRKELQDEIKSVAAQGSLEALLAVITGTDIYARDEEGFNEARAAYAALDSEMKTIKARGKITMGQDIFYLYGLQFSKILAALVFIITLGLVAS